MCERKSKFFLPLQPKAYVMCIFNSKKLSWITFCRSLFRVSKLVNANRLNIIYTKSLRLSGPQHGETELRSITKKQTSIKNTVRILANVWYKTYAQHNFIKYVKSLIKIRNWPMNWKKKPYISYYRITTLEYKSLTILSDSSRSITWAAA